MSAQRVLVLYNQPLLPLDHPEAYSEHTVVEIAEHAALVLREGGFRVTLLGLKQDPGILIREVNRLKPDLVFNLFEGNLDDGQTESYVAGILHWLKIPFTGSPFHTLALARCKHLTKYLLRGAGLPTPDFIVIEQLPVPECDLEWPVIVKPAMQDASVGLDQNSVAVDQEQLDRRVSYLLETYGPPVLVEEFIAGREFNVAVLEMPDLYYLPPAEIRFDHLKPGLWPILTYDGKWKPGTDDYEQTPPQFGVQISQRWTKRLGDLALRAYRLLGCRDYARIDFRVRHSGKPFILEVNPNPEISDTAGFAGCLGSASLNYRDFVLQLAHTALNRKDLPQPTYAMNLTSV